MDKDLEKEVKKEKEEKKEVKKEEETRKENLEEIERNERMFKRALMITLIFLGVGFIIYATIMYIDLQPNMINSKDIIVKEEKTNLENEKLITVTVDDDSVVFYSFDGGKTYQTDNFYKISENKKILIVLKDNERRVVGKKKYGITVKEGTPPRITIDGMPDTIYVGTNFNINDYAKAYDDNNNSIEITYSNNNIDTSRAGTYNATLKATDKNGLTSTITIELKVINYPQNNSNNNPSNNNSGNTQPAPAPAPEPPKKKTVYYRYRTKNTSTYACNYYSCSEVDLTDSSDTIYTFGNDSYCCGGNGCTKENPLIDVNDICIYNYVSGGTCTPKGTSTTPRYAGYGTACYDRSLLITNNTLKTNCSSDEIKIDGYCHTIDSKANATCRGGYIMSNGTCYREIKKTCHEECTYEVWSDWSKWSTTKVVADANTEVQTKEE